MALHVAYIRKSSYGVDQLSKLNLKEFSSMSETDLSSFVVCNANVETQGIPS